MELLWLVVAVIGLLYVLAPAIIKFTLKLRAYPTIAPVAVEEMPPEVYDHFGRTAVALGECGFELITYIVIPDMVANAVAYLALWENRAVGQTSTATVIYSTSASAPTRAKHYTEFITKLADGRSVETSNVAEVSSFKKTDEVVRLRVPQAQDPRILYIVHLNHEAQLATPGAARFLPEPGQEIAVFAAGSAYEIARQARSGYLRLADPAAGVYTATWVGAYMMTWGQLPPIKQIRAGAQRRRGAAELARAQSQGQIPRPARVTISTQSPYGPLPPGHPLAAV
jgi:hypothetical protein